jgi:hypothetical protein
MQIMEAALFYWAKQWIPLLLKKEGWDTPEAGELNQYRQFQLPIKEDIFMLIIL